VTNRRTANRSRDRRRRLRPAASLLVVGGLAGLALIAVAIPDHSRHVDPPAARPLPDASLAAERPLPRRRAARVRRLVDLVDREAPPPRRIAIPAIGVSADVVPLRLEPDGTMQSPDDWRETGWYEPGREPGERGPAVIAGHVDSTSGPAVFYRLRELRRGDVIRIRRADGSVVRFRVEGLERWPKAEFPTRRVFGRTRVSALRLVTCSGDFDASTGHYVDNTIVYAARVPIRRTSG
jgi:Sortase domain